MSIGVILVVIVVYAQLRFVFRDMAALKFAEPPDVQVYINILSFISINERVEKDKNYLYLSFQELRHEIAIWQRAAASLSSYSKDENLVRETLLKKVQRLLSQLKKKLMTGSGTLERYKTTLEELQEKVKY